MSDRLLSGSSEPTRNDMDDVLDELQKTKRENSQLQKVISDLEEQLATQKSAVKRSQLALQNLQVTLAPMHRAMKMIMGEIDAADVPVPDFGEYKTYTVPSPHGPQDAKFAPWIQKFGGTKKAEFIKALLDHGPMTGEQLRVATKSGTSTVGETVGILKNLGLISKENGKWTLKN